jgi:hypothetical protein
VQSCLIILHEDFTSFKKGYQKIAKERIELLSAKYQIDLFIPYYFTKPKKFFKKKNINYFFYKKNLILSFFYTAYKLLFFRPFQVALYYDYGFKAFIKKSIKNKNYDLNYLFLYRGFENIKLSISNFVILDLIDPVCYSLKLKSKNSKLRFFYLMESYLCNLYEKKISKYIHKVILISSRDAKHVNNFKSIENFPHILKKSQFKYSQYKKGNICFSGNLNYSENINHVKWLNKEILPKLEPQQKLYLIGANPKMSFFNKFNKKKIKIIKNPKNIIKEISRFKVSLNGKSMYGSNTKIFDSFCANILPIVTKEVKNDIYFNNYPLIVNSSEQYVNLLKKLIANKSYYYKKIRKVNNFKKKFFERNLKNKFYNIIKK